MESVIGTISSIHGDRATVMVEAPLACRRCRAGRGCGAGLLQSDQGSRQIDVQLPPGMAVEVGNRVRLTVAPLGLLRAATLAYGLPLVAMLAALGVARLSVGSFGDAEGVGFAIIGLIAGLLISRRLLQKDAACDQLVPAVEGLATSGAE